MMSVKAGTQTWTNLPSTQDISNGNGAQSMGAGDKSKILGDDAVGDLANRLTDPNFVDTSKKMRTVGNPELGKDAFMSLLLTQMKNQDPTNPLKSHEMAAQLAQFTTLEKLNNINEGISALHKDQQPSHNFQALGLIGKVITTDNSKIHHAGKETHDVRFTLPADAPQVTMQIKDADGKVVRSMEFRNLKAGKNELSWNGMTDEAAVAKSGDYTVAFEAVGSNGAKLFVETKTAGQISGVNFTPSGPQLMIGKQMIDMSEVKTISDPSMQAEDSAPAKATPSPMMAIPQAAQSAPAAKASAVKPGVST